jgi:RNase P subunit RPR2
MEDCDFQYLLNAAHTFCPTKSSPAAYSIISRSFLDRVEEESSMQGTELGTGVAELFCRRCKAFFIPGHNVTVSMKERIGLQTGTFLRGPIRKFPPNQQRKKGDKFLNHIIYHCLSCNTSTVFEGLLHSEVKQNKVQATLAQSPIDAPSNKKKSKKKQLMHLLSQRKEEKTIYNLNDFLNDL